MKNVSKDIEEIEKLDRSFEKINTGQAVAELDASLDYKPLRIKRDLSYGSVNSRNNKISPNNDNAVIERKSREGTDSFMK